MRNIFHWKINLPGRHPSPNTLCSPAGCFALTVGVLTFVPVRIPEYGTLQEIAYQAAFHCPTGQKAQLACSAAGSLRLVNLSQAWAFLLAITWFSTLAPILPHNCTGNHSQNFCQKSPRVAQACHRNPLGYLARLCFPTPPFFKGDFLESIT